MQPRIFSVNWARWGVGLEVTRSVCRLSGRLRVYTYWNVIARLGPFGLDFGKHFYAKAP